MPTSTVTTMPIDFLARVLSPGFNGHRFAREVLELFPDILMSEMILFPVVCSGQLYVIIAVNPVGLVTEGSAHRGSSFMLSLHACADEVQLDVVSTARRLRILFNRIAERDDKLDGITKRLSAENFRLFSPDGTSTNTFNDVYCPIVSMFTSSLFVWTKCPESHVFRITAFIL
jgi:hypothetical protein